MILAKYLFKPTIIYRQDWKAEKPRKKGDPFKEPATKLVISHSNTPVCNTKEECVKRVQEIQKKDMEETGDDLKANFLVGGDGNVYEGRGFKRIPIYSKNSDAYQILKGNAFEVCFIGNKGIKPTMSMLKAFVGVVLKAAEEKILVDNSKQMKAYALNGDEILEMKGFLPGKGGQNVSSTQLEGKKKKNEK